MRCIFIGVGEAFDETVPNCSLWVEAYPGGERRSVLLDCGFTAASAFWRHAPDPLGLDALWLSHLHGDHFFGVPALLLRFWEEGRTKPLVVVGQPGTEDAVCAAMDMAYPNLRAKFGYALEFTTLRADESVQTLGLSFSGALSEHPRANLSLLLSDGLSTVFYSGDGRPTEATRGLAAGADLIVHESFSLEQDTPGHGTVPGSIEFARQAGCPMLALVHLNRKVRQGRLDEVRALMQNAGPVSVLLPDPGDAVELTP